MANTSQRELQASIEAAKKDISIGAEYVHYKSTTMRYQVIDLAIDTDTSTVSVVYRALYDEGVLFVRPLSQWLDTVTLNGKIVKRFTPIAANS